MDLKKAIDKLMKEYPEKMPIGYWVIDDGYIFNTKMPKSMKGITGAAQFIVKENGEVYGVTPMMYDLDISKMKRL